MNTAAGQKGKFLFRYILGELRIFHFHTVNAKSAHKHPDTSCYHADIYMQQLNKCSSGVQPLFDSKYTVILPVSLLLRHLKDPWVREIE